MAETPFTLGLVTESQFQDMNADQREALLAQVSNYLDSRLKMHPDLQINLPGGDNPVLDVWREAIERLQMERGREVIAKKYSDPKTSQDQKKMIADHMNPRSDSPDNAAWFKTQFKRIGSSSTFGIPVHEYDSNQELLVSGTNEVVAFTDNGTVSESVDAVINQVTGQSANTTFSELSVNAEVAKRQEVQASVAARANESVVTSSNQSKSNSASQNVDKMVQNVDLPEYYFIPGKQDQPYEGTLDDERQTRYWWRDANIKESSPVSTKELRKALESVLPDRTKRRTLEGMLPDLDKPDGDLQDTLYASAYHDESGYPHATLISQKIHGRVYNLSPSQVETMITVMTTLHDAGINYDIISSNQNTIQLKLNDNTGSKITLMDLQHPYLTGQVETREGISWSPMLSHIPYKTATEEAANPNADPTHALANELDQDGNDLRMWQMHDTVVGGKKLSRKIFSNNSQLVENITSFSNNNSDIRKSILRSNERYMGLDQTTKNLLATAGILNTLGINPATFDKNAQEYMPDANVETIDIKSSKLPYTAQLNLGTHKARINRVVQSFINDEGRAVHSTAAEPTQGDVTLDLRGAVWARDIHDTKEVREKIDPYILTPEESTELINQKYAEARINYFDMLTGVDQKNVNRGYEQAQRKFKKILFDEREVAMLTDGSRSMHKERLEPLPVEDQQAVLTAFGSALIQAKSGLDGVNDQALSDALDHLNDSNPNPVSRERRKTVFKNLVAQMQDTFGSAPSYNGPQVRSYTNLTPVEYHHQYDVLQTNKPTWSEDMRQNNDYNKALKALVPDDAPAFIGLEKTDIDKIRDSMTYAELREQTQLVDQVNETVVDNSLASQFDTIYDEMIDQQPLNHGLNVTQIIDHTSDNSQANLYEFKMAQAAGKSHYVSDLVGDNDVASQRIQERAVQFDPDSAQSISDLLVADQDPNSKEAKLRQYIAEVQSGQREFSFDDPDNPAPQAFKFDGPTKDSDGLIVSESPNHFKVDMLREIKSRIEKKLGKDQDGNQIELPDDAIKIDKRGVVHYSADIPMYNSFTHEQMPADRVYRKFSSLTPKELALTLPDGRPKYVNVNGLIKSNDTGSVLEDINNDGSNPQPMVQHLEGSFGQIFPVEHDGRIYSNYNRFPGQDPQSGQIVYQARYRGWLNGIPRNENGDWDVDALRQEQQNGLGMFNRLRVSSYKQGLLREVRQAADLQLSIRDMGNVTRYNSNTSLNKTLHGGVLGEQIKNYNPDQSVNKITQAILEDELNSVRLNDEAMSATKVTALTSYVNNIDRMVWDMRRSGLLDETLPFEEQKLSVIQAMHDPAAIWGNVSVGELANDDAMGFFSDNQTGQGGMLGLLRILVRNTKVNDDGTVEPDIIKNEDGAPFVDKDGHYVFRNSGSAIENLSILDGSYKSAFDRQSVSKEQLKKALRVEEHVGSARMSLGALTMEDGMVVSKAFADRMKISDQLDDKGRPIMRGLNVGDKMSDIAGDKATISAVIDPDMDPVEAEKQGLLDVVQLFKNNPDLDTVWNPTSQISRNNGATAYNYMEHESSDPMSYPELRINENGEAETTGRQIQTNATINDGTIFVTDQTVNHKVSLYDKPGDQGRKASVFMTVADNAKDAPAVANWHLNNGESLRTWHEMTLALGVEFDSSGVRSVDYDQLGEKTSKVDYQLPDDAQKTLDSAFLTGKGAPNAKFKKAIDKNLSGDKPLTTDDHQISSAVLSHLYELNSILGKSSKLNNDPNLRDGSYDAGSKFLEMIPDGGVLKLPDEITVQDHQGNDTNQIYVLPKDLRTNTMSMDDRPITSDTNLAYSRLGASLARYSSIQAMTEHEHLAEQLATQDTSLSVDQWQKQINQTIADSVGISSNLNGVNKEVDKFTYGGSKSNVKNGYVRNEVMGGHPADTVTTQLSSNPHLPMDVIEISPQIAKRLGFENNNSDPQGLAHMKGHEDWDRLHVHRDPIWRPQGSLGFRVKISTDPVVKSVRVNPVMAALMDADFDGDNVGLIAMGSDETQAELKEKMSVDRWMLDNNGERSLLNINAELVDTASRVNNAYTITGTNGEKISGEFNDPEFRKQALENMRDDVVDPKWFNNKDGQERVLAADTTPGREFPPVAQGEKNNTPPSHVSDAEFLAALVDYEIKQHYDQGDYHGARQSVDEMVQKSLGFDVSRDKNGEVIATSGDHQSLANDGVRYTNKEMYYQDLMRYVQTGAKGSQSKVDGLMDYINKPLFSDLQKKAQAQVKDGKLDQKAVDEFRNETRELHDTMKEVQRATKTKSDATGVPGSTQQRFTYPFIDQGIQALKDAVALGQPGTQKVLSIKRDPVGAAQAAELLQVPLGKLLNGQFPMTASPTFSLVGATSNGRLGTDMVDAGMRANMLRSLTVPGTEDQNIRTANPKITDEANFSDDKVKEIMQKIHLPLEKDPDKLKDQIAGFRKTADEATQPFVRDDFMEKMKRELGRDQIPFHQNSKRPTDNPPLAKDEFVMIMKYISNDKDHGLDLNIDDKAIERMADRMVDPNQDNPYDPKAKILKLDDIVGSTGNASLLAKTATQGFDAMSNAAREADRTGNNESIVKTEFERKAFLNMDAETFDEKLYKPDEVKSVNLQTQDFDESTVTKDINKTKFDGENLPLNVVQVSPEDAKILAAGVADDFKPVDSKTPQNYLLRSKTDGDMAVQIEVDDKLKPGEMRVSDKLFNQVSLNLKDAQLVAGDNDGLNDRINNLANTVMTDPDKFTAYQTNAQYQIKKRQLQLKQAELLKELNNNFMVEVTKTSVNTDQVASLEAKSKANLEAVEANRNDNGNDVSKPTNGSQVANSKLNALASGTSSNSQSTTASSAEPTTKPEKFAELQPKTPKGDQTTQILQGIYHSPTSFKGRYEGQLQTANNVAGHLAVAYLQKAQNEGVEIDKKVVDQVNKFANDKSYSASGNQVYANLQKDYNDKTHKQLFTRNDTTINLANGYIHQMDQDKTVRDTLINSRNDISKLGMAPVQSKALSAAIEKYIKVKHLDVDASKKNNGNDPKGPNNVNNGPDH